MVLLDKMFGPFATCLFGTGEVSGEDGNIKRPKRRLSLLSSTTKTFSVEDNLSERSFRGGSEASATRRRIHVQHATRERAATPVSPATFTRRRSFISNDRLVKTLKRDSNIRRRFESFAAKQYAAENVDFVESVLEWKADSPGDLAKAKVLVDGFIREESAYQVNISYHTRVEIERILDGGSLNGGKRVPLDLFDNAMHEVSSMMVEGGIWGSFVWKGGLDLEKDESDEVNHQGIVTLT